MLSNTEVPPPDGARSLPSFGCCDGRPCASASAAAAAFCARLRFSWHSRHPHFRECFLSAGNAAAAEDSEEAGAAMWVRGGFCIFADGGCGLLPAAVEEERMAVEGALRFPEAATATADADAEAGAAAAVAAAAAATTRVPGRAGFGIFVAGGCGWLPVDVEGAFRFFSEATEEEAALAAATNDDDGGGGGGDNTSAGCACCDPNPNPDPAAPNDEFRRAERCVASIVRMVAPGDRWSADALVTAEK